MSHFITGTGTKLAAGLQDNYFYNVSGCTVNVPINITSVTLDPAVEKGTEENLLKKKLKDSSYLLSITMDGSFDANLRPEMADWLFKASTQKADQPAAEEQTIGDKVYTIQEYYLQEPGNDPLGSTFVLTRSDNNVITTYPAMTVRSLTLNAPNNDFVTVSVDLAGREELRAAYTFGPNTMPAKTSGITADGANYVNKTDESSDFTKSGYIVTKGVFRWEGQEICIESCSMTLDNGLEDAPRCYQDGKYVNIPVMGRRGVTFDINLPYTAALEYQKDNYLLSNSYGSLSLEFTSADDENEKVIIEAPYVSLTSIGSGISGTGVVETTISGEVVDYDDPESSEDDEPFIIRVQSLKVGD